MVEASSSLEDSGIRFPLAGDQGLGALPNGARWGRPGISPGPRNMHWTEAAQYVKH